MSSSPELSYIVEAIGNASAIQAQTSFQLKLLQNESKIKVCKDFEEEEGRINTDMLSRLIIVGGPLIQAGPGMQDQLVKQVPFKLIIQFFPRFTHSLLVHTGQFIYLILYSSQLIVSSSCPFRGGLPALPTRLSECFQGQTILPIC